MKKIILALTSAAVTTVSIASSSTSTVSTSTKKSKLDKILEKTNVTYFSEYAGAMLNDASNNSQSNMWNQVSLRYKLTDSINVFASNAFVIKQELDQGEKRYQVDDYRVGAEKWDKYTKDISFRNRVRIESTGEAYEDPANDQTFRLRASHLVTTTINNVHGLTGVVTFRKWFFNNTEDQDASSQYQFIPTAAYSYSITDKLSAYTEYSLGYNHLADKAITNGFKAFQELYVGANYNFHKAFTLGAFVYISGGSGDSGMNIDEDAQLKLQMSGLIF